MRLNAISVLVAAIGLVHATGAFAQQGVGNGGDVVYCGLRSDRPMVELLDLYEAQALRGLHLVPAPQGKNFFYHLNELYQRIETYSPGTAIALRDDVNDYLSNMAMRPGITLGDIPDSGHQQIPQGCELRQVAIQVTTQLPGDKPYVISQDLWEKMDGLNQAALLVHEAIYKRATEMAEHKNSIVTRYLNGFFWSTLNVQGGARDFLRFNHPRLAGGMPGDRPVRPIFSQGLTVLVGDRWEFTIDSAKEKDGAWQGFSAGWEGTSNRVVVDGTPRVAVTELLIWPNNNLRRGGFLSDLTIRAALGTSVTLAKETVCFHDSGEIAAGWVVNHELWLPHASTGQLVRVIGFVILDKAGRVISTRTEYNQPETFNMGLYKQMCGL